MEYGAMRFALCSMRSAVKYNKLEGKYQLENSLKRYLNLELAILFLILHILDQKYISLLLTIEIKIFKSSSKTPVL
jgi:hypothetical protein